MDTEQGQNNNTDGRRKIEIQHAGGTSTLTLYNKEDCKLNLIKLGDKQRGWIPPQRMFQEMSEQLNTIINDPTQNKIVLTHAFVEIEIIDLPKGDVVIVPDAIYRVVDQKGEETSNNTKAE